MSANAKGRQLSSAVVFGVAAIVIFVTMWTIECPDWAQRIGLDCYLVITIGYFVLCPGLALAGVVMAIKDLVQHRLPLQAALGGCMSAGLLTWLWSHPPR